MMLIIVAFKTLAYELIQNVYLNTGQEDHCNNIRINLSWRRSYIHRRKKVILGRALFEYRRRGFDTTGRHNERPD